MMTEQQPIMTVTISGVEYPVYALLPEKQAREFVKVLDRAYENRKNPRKAVKPLGELITHGLFIIAFCLRLNDQQLAAIPPTVLDLLIEQIVQASLGNANNVRDVKGSIPPIEAEGGLEW